MKINGSAAFKLWGYGSDDPTLGSQQTFRAILAAMEYPGQLVTIIENPYAPDIFNSASAAACLTLLDDETPVWTDVDWMNPAINWLQFDCESRVVTEPCMANFAQKYSEEKFDFISVIDHWCLPKLNGNQRTLPLLHINGVELDGYDHLGSYYHVIAVGASLTPPHCGMKLLYLFCKGAPLGSEVLRLLNR